MIILLIIIIFLIPFLLNYWHGYLKPAEEDEIGAVDCKNLSESLKPHVGDIIRVIVNHGKSLDAKNNFNTTEGYKIVRNDIKTHLPQVFEIIENYLKRIEVEHMSMADCDTEQYCWFLRLYNKEGHFLDWHFDNNFTSGLRYTYVCNVFTSDNNQSQFMVKNKNNRIRVISNTSGQGVFYNGSKVKHAISSQHNDAIRIALIVPYYEKHDLTFMGKWRKWARDIIYSNLTL